MQTSPRTLAYGREELPGSKRGHQAQISISDDSHHVTEAIGNMYEDSQYGERDPRHLSFMTPNSSSFNTSDLSSRPARAAHTSPSPPRSLNRPSSVHRTLSSDRTPSGVNSQGIHMASRSNSGKSEHGQLSPSGSLKEASSTDTANAHFPLNDIDYESSPVAINQELNNLAALRRMSMDVNASGDPDLPSFTSNFGIPSAAPQTDDPDDTARLYWVPASVHPELAPVEFKTFLDKKVKSLKRRSEERGSLSPDALQREGSLGGLRRKKSMLSKQIDNTNGRGAVGYTDGAERIERRKSQLGLEPMTAPISNNLQDLEILVNEPERILQRLSVEAGGEGLENGNVPNDDVPILPSFPTGGNSLRRSTRTTYRRGGSLRKTDRAPLSRRGAAHTNDLDGGEQPSMPITPAGEAASLSRVQTEPTPSHEKIPENFSRPGRMNRRAGIPPGALPSSSLEEPIPRPTSDRSEQNEIKRESHPPRHFVSQIASNGRLGIPPEAIHPKTVPSIVEIPPSDDQSPQHAWGSRSSSHAPPPPTMPVSTPPTESPASRMHKMASQSRTNQSVKPGQTLSDMSSHPSPLPGNNTRTDSLSFIPTLTEDKKADGKKGKDKKGNDVDGGRKSSWSWGSLLGNEEKEKEKRKVEEDKEAKKSKSRLGAKILDKSYDNTRLDVLQTTMEGNRGRESIVLDRGDLKLEEERKKESSRKSAGSDTKKEKDPGFFSSLLGGGKRKADRDVNGKKYPARNLSPEPSAKILKPDIDYNWTRFSILEERAIYRMAHIKLANPRRALHSQVLLSNFMYSYLAKVQQMHPQANLPQSAAQRQAAAQQKKEVPEEFSAYQKYQEILRLRDQFMILYEEDHLHQIMRLISMQQQQRQQQQQEHEQEQQAAALNVQAPALAPVTQQEPSGSFMDMDYDYDESSSTDSSGHRPQSRTTQHQYSHDGRNGAHTHGHGSHHRHQQGQQQRHQHAGYGRQPQANAYSYQENQFDEPARQPGDDMW